MKRKIGIGLVLILVLIQFIRPAKNQSTEILASDITKITQVPEDVLQILKVSCYDCHSNKTVYPWYNNIQPIGFWLQHHVNEGKEHLNFSEFGTYPADKATRKMRRIVRDIEERDMPLGSYLLIHKNAVLTEAQKQLVLNWAKHTVVIQSTH